MGAKITSAADAAAKEQIKVAHDTVATDKEKALAEAKKAAGMTDEEAAKMEADAKEKAKKTEADAEKVVKDNIAKARQELESAQKAHEQAKIQAVAAKKKTVEAAKEKAKEV